MAGPEHKQNHAGVVICHYDLFGSQILENDQLKVNYKASVKGH